MINPRSGEGTFALQGCGQISDKPLKAIFGRGSLSGWRYTRVPPTGWRPAGVRDRPSGRAHS